MRVGGKRGGQRTTGNGQRFSAVPRIALLFRPFSFRLSPSFPPKLLRKGCGKNRAQSDVQKMRKRRGKSADSPADLLRESGGEAVGKRFKRSREFVELSRCNCEYLSSIHCSFLAMTSLFFVLPLTEGSTRRSLSCNHNISARGRDNEGCKAIAFGRSFPS